MGWIIIGALFLLLLLVPFGYMLLPLYAIYRPKNFHPLISLLYVVAIWAAGVVPALSLLAYGVMSQMPGLRSSGGEPGLNFGYDVGALIVGVLLCDASHFVIWVLLFASRSSRLVAP